MVWPTWRTRMPPARTFSPPKTFTPRNCAFDPRPFREEPPPFLCAMCSALHLGDLDGRVALAVPGLLARALALAKLEDDELVAFHVTDDLRLDGGAGDLRLADLGCVAA